MIRSRASAGAVALIVALVVSAVVPAGGAAVVAAQSGGSGEVTPEAASVTVPAGGVAAFGAPPGPLPGNDSDGPPVQGLDAGDLPDGSGAGLRNFDGDADGPVPVVVVVAADAGESVGTYVARLQRTGATVRAVSGRSVSVRIDPDRVGDLREEPWVERVRRPFEATPAAMSEGVEVVNAELPQQTGITGENVSVGILDLSGFAVNDSEISDNVTDFRSFSGEINDSSQHGTAVAEVVLDTAPGADLHVAKFGNFVEYRNAVDWLLDRDVDVVVMAANFYGQPNDGTGPVSEVAEWAPENDTTWVNAAGNTALNHWEGQFSDGDDDYFHNFDGADELNYLNGGRPFETTRPVEVFLTWDDWHATDQDYDLYLYNEYGEIVASSTFRQNGDDRAYEAISTTVEAGTRYAVAVWNYGAYGNHTLELFASTGGPFEYRTASSSVVAPAVAPGVTAVGAVDYEDRSLQWYSARGPADDGRRALDLVGPDGVSTEAYGSEGFSGTSAAAAHVGGVAALVESANDSLSAADLEDLLTDTAVDLESIGPDERTGYGLVDAGAALSRVTDAYPPRTPTVTRDAPTTMTQGKSASVTVNVTVDEPADSLRLVERFDRPFAAVTVEAAAVSGPGSVDSADATTDRVAVEVRNLANDSRLTVTYRVTAPTDETGVFGIVDEVTVENLTLTGDGDDVTVQEATRPSDPGTANLPDERTGTELANFAGADATPGPVSVALELAPDAGESPESYADQLRDRGASVESVSDRWILARIDPTRIAEYRGIEWVADLGRPLSPGAADHTTEGVGAIDADAVHDAGTTGEGVTVGILDPGGFDLSNPEIADNVVASQSFAGGIGEGGDHGTAVAEVVVDTAPGADLYVANFEDVAGYHEAAEWLQEQGVDVIVMGANVYGGPNDGTGAVSEIADGAVGTDAVWVNAAGNDAQNHWEGEFADGDGDGIHNFSSSTEYNFLADGSMLSAGDRVRAWLTWDDWPDTAQDYDLYLFDGEGDVVARSERAQDGDDPPRETIDATVPESGYYSLAVVNHDADGDATLELFVQEGGPLSAHTAAGSLLAPATAENVTAVGAVDPADGSLEAFSGRGPLPDGSQGVDLAGPDRVSPSVDDEFVGTSAAAGYVAGAAALVAAANDSLGPAVLEEVLTASADDLGAAGPDPATGAGLVNASAAVDRARSSPTAPPAPSFSRDAPSYLPPGESATVTTTVTARGATDRLELTESFDPGFASVTIESVDLAGGGSVVERAADPAGVAVAATDLSAGDTLTVTYRVTAPDVAETTVAVSGAVELDGATTAASTDEVLVHAQSDARTTSRTSVAPGGSVTVTTQVAFEDGADRVSIAEEFPSSASATVEDVAIDGEGSVLFSTGDDGRVSVALQGVSAGTTVAVTYELSVPGSLEAGDALTVRGSVTAGETRSLGATTFTVASGLSAYANEEGVVDTDSLRAVINAWARDEVSTAFLRRAIRAWASGEPVE